MSIQPSEPFDPEEILKKYTVDELDVMHDLSGLGVAWRSSYRRRELVAVEERQLMFLQEILEDFKGRPDALMSQDCPEFMPHRNVEEDLKFHSLAPCQRCGYVKAAHK